LALAFDCLFINYDHGGQELYVEVGETKVCQISKETANLADVNYPVYCYREIKSLLNKVCYQITKLWVLQTSIVYNNCYI